MPVLSYDEQILKGWYNRPSDWAITATIQQEILPRISVEVGFTRRWLQNFTVTDNRAVTPADFTMFSVTAPNDPRLPGGGGASSRGSTTSTRTSSARWTTSAPTRPPTGTCRRCTTAWMST